MVASRVVLFPLVLAAACVSSPRATLASSPPCFPEACFPEACVPDAREPGLASPDPPESASPASESAPVSSEPTTESATLRPGRYWFRNNECTTLDVRVVWRGQSELTEFAMHAGGGVHSSEGTVFYLAQEQVLVSGGFRQGEHSLEHGCNVRGEQPMVSSGMFGGVLLYDERESCEAQDCTEGPCSARFGLGDCPDAVATSARRLRRVRNADQASRQRTQLRFQRMGRRGRMWTFGGSECVVVRAKREGEAIELRHSEDVEDGRWDTTANYILAPLDLRASLRSSVTVFTPRGGGLGGREGAFNRDVPLYFGDGMIILGTTDLFFERVACEANRRRSETGRAVLGRHVDRMADDDDATDGHQNHARLQPHPRARVLFSDRTLAGPLR